MRLFITNPMCHVCFNVGMFLLTGPNYAWSIPRNGVHNLCPVSTSKKVVCTRVENVCWGQWVEDADFTTKVVYITVPALQCFQNNNQVLKLPKPAKPNP